MREAVSTFQNYLKSRNLKWTPERQEIAALMLTMRDHFEADDILVRLRNKKSRIAKGTIYRTLKHLVDSGVLKPVIFTDRHAHYELAVGHKRHSHVVCRKCGKIVEFCNPRIQEELGKTGQKYNFIETSYKVEITGYCKKCREAKTSGRNK